MSAAETYRIAADIGGTFTDLVVSTEGGRLRFNKAPTRAGDPWSSINEALELISAEVGLTVDGLLERSEVFWYATTRATNAILTGTSARTAFVTTAGFPDILTLRQGGRVDPFDFRSPFPEPYVPRSLTFELPGRIDAQGRELSPFDAERAAAIADEMVARGCAAVAVSLLWAQANPMHELAFADVLRERAPELSFTLSHQLNPIIREYPRASSTALDASLKPLMQDHIGQIDAALRRHGFAGELLTITSSGGCLPAAEMIEKPIYAIDSGPSVAPVAARAYGQAESEVGSLVVFDTGGTSFDVTLVSDGVIAVTRDRWLGEEFTGDLLGIASIGVYSIGAGGGSIASLDAGGLLRVGPESAGSDPGPACYGRGGQRPTVTDAYLVMGYLNRDYFLGGRIPLDEDAARAAIAACVADPLRIGVEAAAAAIVGVADQAMVDAITEITVNQGVDPRDCLLVAGGGAGGLNAVTLARELGCRQILVPAAAGALSAVGAQYTDIVAEFARSDVMSTADFVPDRYRQTMSSLEELIEQFGARIESALSSDANLTRDYFVEARYTDQVWDLRVPIDWSRPEPSDAELAQTVSDFHDHHERTFAVRHDTSPVECQQWIARVVAPLTKPSLQIERSRSDTSAVVTRSAWFGGEMTATRCVRNPEAGEAINGPAIVEEPMTTLILPPGSRASVTSLGNYLVQVA